MPPQVVWHQAIKARAALHIRGLLGYHEIRWNVEILMPTKKPLGAELTLEQHLANQALHQRRLRIEHVNSSVKRCRI